MCFLTPSAGGDAVVFIDEAHATAQTLLLQCCLVIIKRVRVFLKALVAQQECLATLSNPAIAVQPSITVLTLIIINVRLIVITLTVNNIVAPRAYPHEVPCVSVFTEFAIMMTASPLTGITLGLVEDFRLETKHTG